MLSGRGALMNGRRPEEKVLTLEGVTSRFTGTGTRVRSFNLGALKPARSFAAFLAFLRSWPTPLGGLFFFKGLSVRNNFSDRTTVQNMPKFTNNSIGGNSQIRSS